MQHAMHDSVLSSDDAQNAFVRSEYAHEWEDKSLIYSQVRAEPSGKQLPSSDTDRWIRELNSSATRQRAIQLLSKSRERIPELGLSLWHSFGAVSSLIQEIIISYSRSFSPLESGRICDVLSLLLSVAEHPRARIYFVRSNLHEIVAPLAKQGKTDEYTEPQRTKALQILCALTDPTAIDGRLWACEHPLIVRQIMADQSILAIFWNTVRFGQRQSILLVIQLIERLFVQADILVLLLQSAQNLERLVKVLDQLLDFCSIYAPSLSPTVKGFRTAIPLYLEQRPQLVDFDTMNGSIRSSQDQFFEDRFTWLHL